MLSATPHLKSYANASVSKCMFKVVVDEEKNSSTVVFGCDLDVSACVYESKTLMLPRDVYSVTNEISIKKDVVQLSCPVACFSSSERVMGVTDVEIDDNADVVCVIAERIEGLSEIAENQNVVGSVCATVIFQDENGKLYGKEASLPFDVSLNVRPDGNYTVKAVIEGFNYRARSSVDFEAVIRFCFTEYSNQSFDAITGLEIGDEKVENSNAISVYVASKNDTLWDVCKHLGVSAEVISELNPEVSFPLTGNERLIVYRTL